MLGCCCWCHMSSLQGVVSTEDNEHLGYELRVYGCQDCYVAGAHSHWHCFGGRMLAEDLHVWGDGFIQVTERLDFASLNQICIWTHAPESNFCDENFAKFTFKVL